MLRILGKIQRIGIVTEPLPKIAEPALSEIGEQLKAGIGEQFGGSLAIREVDAGSCNGCELEIHALNNPFYALENLGIQFVASPRHADMLLVTGPVSKHMEDALRLTYEAMPEPKVVVALGDCGKDGGVFCKRRNYACAGGVSKVVPVDVMVPGCPPEPEAILQGILTATKA